MSTPWRDDHWDDDAPSEPQWSPELSFGDPDAWRGAEGGRTDAPWGDDQSAALDGWPEWDAGPEYQMWKRLADNDEY